MTTPILKSVKAKDIRRWDIIYVLEAYRGVQRVYKHGNVEIEFSNGVILVLDPECELPMVIEPQVVFVEPSWDLSLL